MTAYYNEFDPFAAAWLRNLISEGLIADGFVDERSILDVEPTDLAGYTQCHFFAGIGGWSLALRLAGWPDDKPIWTGSPPCQPYSVAGKGKAQADARHLWPELFRLIAECRPPVVFGEQVANAIGKGWLDGVFADLEGENYACGALVLPACGVDAPHKRDRVWFVANANSQRALKGSRHGSTARYGHSANAEGSDITLADTDDAERRTEEPRQNVNDWQATRRVEGDGVAAECGAISLGDTDEPGLQGRLVHAERGDKQAAGPRGLGSFWSNHEWVAGADGKYRRVVADLRGLVDGLPESLGGLCDEYFSEAAEAVITYAETTQSRPDQVLRTVWDQTAPEEVWQELGGFFGIQQEEILRLFLFELSRRIDGVGLRGSGEETAGKVLRSVRVHIAASRPPQGRKSDEQRPSEHPDPMRVLSQLLARHARQALKDMRADAGIVPLLLPKGAIPNRVGMLKGFGNAIVPFVAAEFIRAFIGEAA